MIAQRHLTGLALAAGLVAAAPAPASAAPPAGDPVPAFGGGLPVALPEAAGAGLIGLAEGPGGVTYAAQVVRAGSATTALRLARLLPDGALDPAFGAGGLVQAHPRTFDLLAGTDAYTSGAPLVAVAPDGRVVVAASTVGPLFGGTVVARFGTDGQPDAAFGDAGVWALRSSPGEPAGAGWPSGLMVDAGGRILLVAQGGLARLGPDGRPDPAFGAGGLVDAPVTTRYSGLAVDRAGRILVADRAGGGRVLRLTDAGRADPSFGRGGAAPLPATCTLPSALALRVLPGGRIAVAGMGEIDVLIPSGPDDPEGGGPVPVAFGLSARLSAAGAPVPMAGGRPATLTGPEWTPDPALVAQGGSPVAIGPDGASYTSVDGGGVLRRTPAGLPDRRFGPAGVARDALAGARGALLVTPAGLLASAGSSVTLLATAPAGPPRAAGRATPAPPETLRLRRTGARVRVTWALRRAPGPDPTGSLVEAVTAAGARRAVCGGPREAVLGRARSGAALRVRVARYDRVGLGVFGPWRTLRVP